jgi:uncharacterized caspase-like protein
MRCFSILAVCTIAGSLWAQSSHAAADRVALVIGNGAYENAAQLANPPNDASDVATALRHIGFDVVEGHDLTKRDMEGKIREFGRKLDSAGLALFFYAGHGLQVSGRNYLVPIDAKLDRSADLNFEAFDVNLVLQQMEAEKRVNLVFLDACRDNPLARSLARSMGTRSAAVGQGLATIQGNVGTMIAYATQPDNVAMDGEGRNSPFTTALLKYIDTPGLEISSLMKRVRSDVVAATRDRQVPWDHSSLMGDVVLVPSDGSPQIAAPSPVAPPAAAPSASLAPSPATPAPATRTPENMPDNLPALTREILKKEPPIGQLPPNASVLIDDGTCPRGKIKQVIGGNIVLGVARKRSCVARP